MGDLNLQLPLPGTAEGSGDEVPLVSTAVDETAADGSADAATSSEAATLAADGAPDGEAVLAVVETTVVIAESVQVDDAPEGDVRELVAALEGTGADDGEVADDAAFDDEVLEEDEFDADGGEDEALGVKIQAVAFDDDLADLDGDGEADPDERDAAAPDATGLVAAPPSRDD